MVKGSDEMCDRILWEFLPSMDVIYAWGKCNIVWPYVPVMTSPLRPMRAWSPVDCNFYPGACNMYTSKRAREMTKSETAFDPIIII